MHQEETAATKKVKAGDHNQHGLFTIIAVLLPVVGIILGIVYVVRKNLLDRKLGEHTIAVSVLALIIWSVLLSLLGNSATPALTTAGVSPTTPVISQTPTPPTTYKAGDIISFDSKTVQVSDVVKGWSSGNPYMTPTSGNEYVKVSVNIKNNSASEIAYNTFDWKIQDSKGVIKDVDPVSFTADGNLASGNLAPQGQVSGLLVFQVPLNDPSLSLQYSPSFWSDHQLSITL